MSIRHVVLDFDGTCTQVDVVQQGFLETYGEILAKANQLELSKLWPAALAEVRARSPKAGWTLLHAPATAPACADPYILAFEAAELLLRRKAIKLIPANAFHDAYDANRAPWRTETAEVLRALDALGMKIGFISNSSTDAVGGWLDVLLGVDAPLRAKITVLGGAAKFRVGELALERPDDAARAAFEEVPALHPTAHPGRPVYLHRAPYFEALCALWKAQGASYAPAETIVCGDIWELDLALPQQLGAAVHLVERTPPFPTYDYERAQVPPEHRSPDLHGLLARVS